MNTDTQTKTFGHWSESKGVNTPAPNKAQHSTLPWFTIAQPKADNLHPMVSVWAGSETRESIVCNSCTPQDAKLIVRAVNHADKLAEALRECRMALTLDYHGSTKPKKALCDVSAAASQAHNKAVLALQEWEQSQ